MPFLPCFYLPPFARLFGPLSWRLSFSWHSLATICAYFANWAGPCPSLALCFDMAVSLLFFLLSVGLSGLLNGIACPPPCLGCLPSACYCTYLFFDAGPRGGPAFASTHPSCCVMSHLDALFSWPTLLLPLTFLLALLLLTQFHSATSLRSPTPSGTFAVNTPPSQTPRAEGL